MGGLIVHFLNMIYVEILFDTLARGGHYNASIVHRSRSRECPRQTIARDLVVIVLGASTTISVSQGSTGCPIVWRTIGWGDWKKRFNGCPKWQGMQEAQPGRC